MNPNAKQHGPQQWDVFDVSLELIRALRGPLVRITTVRCVAHNADSSRRFIVSLNLSEGRRRAGRDRIHSWRIAAGSAEEVAHRSSWLTRGLRRTRFARPSLELLDRIFGDALPDDPLSSLPAVRDPSIPMTSIAFIAVPPSRGSNSKPPMRRLGRVTAGALLSADATGFRALGGRVTTRTPHRAAAGGGAAVAFADPIRHSSSPASPGTRGRSGTSGTS